jgi:hypothetical protein
VIKNDLCYKKHISFFVVYINLRISLFSGSIATQSQM